MHHSLKAARWMRSVLVGGVLLPLSFSLFAAEPSQALMMGKADKSLLLDIQRKGDQLVAVGERGHILLSADQGKSWVQSPVPTAQMLTAVYFADEQNGWAVGHDGNIVHSRDGGKTWILQRDGLEAQGVRNQLMLKESVAEARRLQKLISAGVSEENDEGLSLEEQLEEAEWQVKRAQERLQSKVSAPPLMDVWFADAQNGWAAGSFGILLQTTDGGETWVERSRDINNDDEFHLNAIVGSAGVIYIAGEAGFLIYSADNGQSWTQADLGYEGTLFGIFAAPDDAFVITTGLRGNTYRSSDNGESWQELAPGVDYSLAAGSAYGAGNVVLVGAGGTIAVSHDNGDSFSQYTLPARASLSSVLALEDGQFILVGQGGVHRFTTNAVAK